VNKKHIKAPTSQVGRAFMDTTEATKCRGYDHMVLYDCKADIGVHTDRGVVYGVL
jgi:hypothetical protein